MRHVSIPALVLLLGSVLSDEQVTVQFTPTMDGAPTSSLRVLAEFPHDSQAFTQGFEVHDGIFWESTGLYGQSTLRTVNIKTGEPENVVHIQSQYFAEGMTLRDDRIYQITWRRRKGFIYDKDTLTRVGEFSYNTEGWGLTHDGTHFIMSDGSAKLYFLDPQTFEVEKQVTVRDGNRTVRNINELEMIGGYVFANLWYRDQIAIIDPESGNVVAWLDCQSLKAQQQRGDVLNGIAYDDESNRLFLTGKLWSKVYEVEMPDLDVLHQ